MNLNYFAVVSGSVASDQLLVWTVECVDELGKTTPKTVSLELPKGSVSKDFFLLRSYQFGKFCVEEKIIPEIVVLPRMSDFDPDYSPKRGFILAREPILMNVNVKRRYPNVNWEWTVDEDRSALLRGESFEQRPTRSKTYRVCARYRQTRFRSPSKSVRVEVKQPDEIIDFSIAGPAKVLDDTSVFTMRVSVLKNLLAESIDWKWYRIDGKDNEVVHIGPVYSDKSFPLPSTVRYRVCAFSSGRSWGCRDYRQKINVLPGPSTFYIDVPATIYNNQPAIIKAVTSGPKPSVWVWSLDGKITSTSGNEYTIKQPRNGMRICVYPLLNRKGGRSKERCIVLSNVRLRTTLPLEVVGPKTRCSSSDTKKFVYRLKGAVLGSDASEWVLYEGGRRLRALKKGSDTMQLAPRQTTVYSITTNSDTARSLSFTIQVIESPFAPKTISSPESVCAGKPFRLFALGVEVQPNVELTWYRRLKGQKSDLPIGRGVSVDDSLSEAAHYRVVAVSKGCTTESKTIRAVSVLPAPSQPTLMKLQYLDKRHTKADIEVRIVGGRVNVVQWSDDKFATVSHTGPVWEGVRVGKEVRTLQVRAMDSCGNPSPIMSLLLARNRSSPKRGAHPPEKSLFLNAGIVSNDFSMLGNMRMAFGTERVYASVVFNPFSLFSSKGYQDRFGGRILEIDANGRVTNFPPSTGSYYVVNGDTRSNKTAAMVGYIFGRGSFRAHLAGGFGARSMEWGLDVEPYSGGGGQKIWARQSLDTWRGPTLETGAMIFLGRVHLMAGLQVIFDSGKGNPFIDAGMGVGIKFKRQ